MKIGGVITPHRYAQMLPDGGRATTRRINILLNEWNIKPWLLEKCCFDVPSFVRYLLDDTRYFGNSPQIDTAVSGRNFGLVTSQLFEGIN